MNKKLIMEALSMDLLRVALGLHRGSFKVAEKFKQEALKREEKLESLKLDLYLQSLLVKIKIVLTNINPEQAEELLMYSTLCRNLSQRIGKCN